MKCEPKKSRGLMAARVFRPPIPIEVVTRPSRVNEPGEIQIASIVGHGDVHISSGPWQVEEGWWRSRPDVREYWDVELDRGIYRVYRGAGWEVDVGYW
jgi:hypothetical protein